MGRRIRTQDTDEATLAGFSAKPRALKDQKRQEPKQSRRQRAADDQAAQKFDATLKKLLPTRPMTVAQSDHLENLLRCRLNLATGPAGTGKTYCPVAAALDLLAAGRVQRLLFLRPTVEAGTRLGFLPGDLDDKIDPFFAPIRGTLAKKLGSLAFAGRWIEAARENGTLVFGSIQHLRGETLENCFVHLDDGQNCSYHELKLIVTRMGEGSLFSFCGDGTGDQNDLPGGVSGWNEFVARLAPLQDVVAVTRYTEDDVVRDPLLKRILPHL